MYIHTPGFGAAICVTRNRVARGHIFLTYVSMNSYKTMIKLFWTGAHILIQNCPKLQQKFYEREW